MPEDVTFTVSELNRTISGALEEAFPGEIWVRGEIQQYHVSRNQHTYFELVEVSLLAGEVKDAPGGRRSRQRRTWRGQQARSCFEFTGVAG